jgi:methionyl-tRNA formyltransferase
MRLAFMGTPDFAAVALKALSEAGHDIAAVYCQPARPAGRGQKLQPSAVETLARDLGLPVRTPVKLRDPAEIDTFRALNLDAAVVAAYGLILPQAVLDAPRLGCFNIHGSLLPRWRGAAPIQRAILAGDTESGITIMQMEAGLDTGPMLLRETLPLTAETTGGSLHDDLAALGARLMVRLLENPAAYPAEQQPEEGVTYAAKISKDELRLNLQQTAEAAHRQIRAFAPRPGVWLDLAGERVKILAARPMASGGTPGRLTVDGDKLSIGCDGGSLDVITVQRQGGRPVAIADALRGWPLPQELQLPLETA